MDSSVEQRPRRPSTIQDSTHCHFHHHSHPRHRHHHHFRVSPNCPFHSYMLPYFKNHHSPTCPLFAALPPQSQYPQSFISVPFPNPFNLQLSQSKDSGFDNAPGVMVEENEEQQLEEEEEEEEDAVFVLTDEWMEFFAKSEAKRRLAKKEARKKGKNVTEQ